MLGRERIQYKTPDQVVLMRRAGLVVAQTLAAVRERIRPGITVAALDEVAATTIREAGATPNFLNYDGYPAVSCISVNEEIVHGIPGPRVLAAGDLVSVDCGAIVDGWHGDSAFSTIVPGEEDPEDVALVELTEQAMWHGIAAIVAGRRVGDIGGAIEDFVADRFGLVENYGGHGIGTEMHQAPHVLNYRTRERGPRLRPGLVLAIEPMLTRGNPATQVLDDGWTVVTVAGGRAAHWEHTVALLEDGLWVLTAQDGGVAVLTGLGAQVSALAR